MRIGIIGAGALGSVFGGLLAEAGNEVYLYEINESIVDAIDRNGIRIERPDGRDAVVSVPVSKDAAAFEPVEALFVFTKAYHTEQAVRDAAPMIDAETHVVTLQNGVTNMVDIAKRVPEDRVIGGQARVGANVVGAGHVIFLGAKQSTIGGGAPETTEAIADVLTNAGLPTEAVDDPLPHIWKKQLRNVARKPIAALTELPNGPQNEYEETRTVATHLIRETMAVAQARGVEIPVDDPVEWFLQPVSPEKYDKKSSILEDVENGRRTEIDHINGAVVEYARQEGIEVPYNELVTALVRAKERSYGARVD